MNTSSMVHSSTLDPTGGTIPTVSSTTMGATVNGGKVRVLMRAPFQYIYGSKSVWVTTGEWMVLDVVKDKEEILYLDSPSNPYRQFIHMEGQAQVGVAEEKGIAYRYGISYQDPNPQPVVRPNALLPPEEPSENPYILETLARAGLQPTPIPLATSFPDEEEVVPTVPAGNANLPTYGDAIEPEPPIEAVVMDTISHDIPTPSAREMREAELRAMKVNTLKALATSMGLEYKDKETTIRQILERG